MNERTKKAFDFAQQSVTQLITLASATIALEVTLLKDLVEDRSGWTKWFAEASWLLFLLSIIFGVIALLEMAGTLDPKRPKKAVLDADLSIYKPRVLRVYAAFQFLFFVGGLFSTILLGFNTIGAKKAPKESSPTVTTTPSLVSCCPVTPAPEKKQIILRSLHFDFNQSRIRPSDRAILDEAVEALKPYVDLNLRVNGYCDAVGSDKYNRGLSERRAQSVASYLASRGMPREHLFPRGYGKTNYLATNASAEGRAENRRVELIR